MKILLVNINQFRTPPAIPLGLEYIAGAVLHAGYEAEVLDLCFMEDPQHRLKEAIAGTGPDCIGISIRQVDTAGTDRKRPTYET